MKDSLFVATEILSFVGNLEDIYDAREFARLYLLALHNANKETGNKDNFKDEEVYQHIADVDTRF